MGGGQRYFILFPVVHLFGFPVPVWIVCVLPCFSLGITFNVCATCLSTSACMDEVISHKQDGGLWELTQKPMVMVPLHLEGSHIWDSPVKSSQSSIIAMLMSRGGDRCRASVRGSEIERRFDSPVPSTTPHRESRAPWLILFYVFEKV